MSVVPFILASILCAVAGQVSFKSGMNRVGRIGRGPDVHWRAGVPRLFVGLCAYGTSMLLWLYTLSRAELSFAFPFLSLSYVAIVLIARFGLGEVLHRNRVVGSGLIVCGVILVGLSGSLPRHATDFQDQGRPVALLAGSDEAAVSTWVRTLGDVFGATDVLDPRATESFDRRRLVVVPRALATTADDSLLARLWRYVHGGGQILFEAPDTTVADALGLRLMTLEQRTALPWPEELRPGEWIARGLRPPDAVLPIAWTSWRYAPRFTGRKPGFVSEARLRGRVLTWRASVGTGAWHVLTLEVPALLRELENRPDWSAAWTSLLLDGTACSTLWPAVARSDFASDGWIVEGFAALSQPSGLPEWKTALRLNVGGARGVIAIPGLLPEEIGALAEEMAHRRTSAAEYEAFLTKRSAVLRDWHWEENILVIDLAASGPEGPFPAIEVPTRSSRLRMTAWEATWPEAATRAVDIQGHPHFLVRAPVGRPGSLRIAYETVQGRQP